MAIARVTTWNAGDVLTAAALNAEYNNILNNATSLISPLTSDLDAGGKSITSVNELTATGVVTVGLIVAGTGLNTITTSAGLVDSTKLSVPIKCVVFCVASAGPSGNTVYFGPTVASNITETVVFGHLPYGGTVKNLYVATSAAVAQNTTLYLRINAANSAVVVGILSGQSSGSDVTHSAAVTAGQSLTVSAQSAGDEATGKTFYISFEVDAP